MLYAEHICDTGFHEHAILIYDLVEYLCRKLRATTSPYFDMVESRRQIRECAVTDRVLLRRKSAMGLSNNCSSATGSGGNACGVTKERIEC
jgi:hypothetical protein